MMHDCDNGDVRDLLPLRLHGTLDALGHARVDAHLAQCASCVEELALLRLVRVHQRRLRAEEQPDRDQEEERVAGDRMILLATQHDIGDEEPTPEKIYDALATGVMVQQWWY